MQCKKCNSTNLIKSGTTTRGKTTEPHTIYTCKDCGCRGTMTTDKGGRPKIQSVCEICGKKAFAKGLCQTHYRQMKKKFS
jgi:RNase P subunit RPR2